MTSDISRLLRDLASALLCRGKNGVICESIDNVLEKTWKFQIMAVEYSMVDLWADLRALGVMAGDILFIHSSFKSLGPVSGGAETVIGALEKSVGPDGLLLMPVFNLKPKTQEARIAAWNIETTPSSVGWLTEYFRRLPACVRSNHYSHSVAARGRGADEIVDNKCPDAGYDSPWDNAAFGKTFGSGAVMVKACQTGGRLLMLGVDYYSATYIHYVEVVCWNRRRVLDPDASYVWLKRELLGEYWDSLGRLARGRVGDADCRLFSIRDFVDELVAEVERNPGLYSK